MKKILFASAFALIGTFAMANESTSKNEKEIGKDEKAVEAVAACGSWQLVTVECGKNFSLCKDGKDTQQLADEAWFFSQDRC